MKLIFATNNQHKADEIRSVLNGPIELVTLKEAGIDIDIPEPYDTLEENARTKSTTIFEMTGTNCFSEDTGLEVDALGGEPGVKSARYAGPEQDFAKNVGLLLTNMQDNADRRARFRTVISLLLDGREYQFEGTCEGEITLEASGNSGFGYDPVFIPDGSDRTFADMSLEEKNKFSHRKKATALLADFLKQYYGKD